jgi:AAA domain-containing protein
MPGMGKTTLVGTLPPEETGICAVDSGNGSGLLPICERAFDYIEPAKLLEVEDFVKGKTFPDKKWLVIDNLSTLARTIIKDAALAIPISGSASRAVGVPDLKDYGTIAEFTRRLLNNLITGNPDKHILVLAHEKFDRPSDNDAPGTESLVGPDLSGQLFLAAPSLFDFVFRLRVRSLLRNPADAKTRYLQRYLQCSPSPGVIAKCRAFVKGKSVLNAEELVDLETGEGTLPAILAKIAKAYAGS